MFLIKELKIDQHFFLSCDMCLHELPGVRQYFVIKNSSANGPLYFQI